MKENLVLNEKLKPTATGLTLYELLGVNVDAGIDEINENYNIFEKIFDKYPNSLSQEEVELIKEAKNKLVSNLGRVYYESKLNSAQINNIREQYNAKQETQYMFDALNRNIGHYATVLYMERYQDNAPFSTSKTVGILSQCLDYDKISLENKDISFLGYDSAVIEILGDDGKILYINKYLESFSDKYNGETVNDFREASWGYFMTRIKKIEEQGKKSFTKVKKI